MVSFDVWYLTETVISSAVILPKSPLHKDLKKAYVNILPIRGWKASPLPSGVGAAWASRPSGAVRKYVGGGLAPWALGGGALL